MLLLNKSLYGLKQSPRQWNKNFDDHMLNIGFTRSKHDNCACIKWKNQIAIAFLLLYVDDMLIACSDMAEIESLKEDSK